VSPWRLRLPRLVAAFLIVPGLLAPARVEAYMLCGLLGICPYISPGFTLTVVDAESGKPVGDVYAWAEWVQYANHGLNGPIMIQEAQASADGRLVFPWWGPRFGYRSGLDIGSDPAVILFKPGYATLIVQNGERPGMRTTDAIRVFTRNGETLRLQRFAGSIDERVRQLRALAFSPTMGRMSDDQAAKFRAPYLKRFDLATAELDRLPKESEPVARLRSSLEFDRTFFTGARR
jgi:hypothetical protein